ncbi:hypothetical protein [uncultured Tissierella sp.]|jgi:hypothetical protein|uniref:hypothetical protein n=1 Tax=uncultured Tissierella sp. TaxID=448160 RepID=UPI0028043222|nr:hypothetical protein [uncultured Tissierella sp.]MDU5080398.1 hypothetical protein [Bacillota bacterium]
MERIPNIKNNPEFDIYYQSENLQNTDFTSYENLDSRRPDAYVGFSNDIFLYPQSFFTNFDDLEWYDEL